MVYSCGLPTFRQTGPATKQQNQYLCGQSRDLQQKIHVDGVIREDDAPSRRLLQHPRPQQNMDVAVNRAHITASPPRNLANRQRSAAGHHLEECPALRRQRLPQQLLGRERDPCALLLTAERSGGPALGIIQRTHAHRHGTHFPLLRFFTSSQKFACNASTSPDQESTSRSPPVMPCHLPASLS